MGKYTKITLDLEKKKLFVHFFSKILQMGKQKGLNRECSPFCTHHKAASHGLCILSLLLLSFWCSWTLYCVSWAWHCSPGCGTGSVRQLPFSFLNSFRQCHPTAGMHRVGVQSHAGLLQASSVASFAQGWKVAGEVGHFLNRKGRQDWTSLSLDYAGKFSGLDL